uniref:AMP-binding domain-containing protein n=1 Tax=Angiostrongylus cantonensis TaxID=6313 RepID=A0A0K0D8B5_ANGCA
MRNPYREDEQLWTIDSDHQLTKTTSKGYLNKPSPTPRFTSNVFSSIMDVNSTTYPFPLCHVGDIVHGVLPYFHAGGLITIFCTLFQGATVVINRKWNQERFLRVIQEYKVFSFY